LVTRVGPVPSAPTVWIAIDAQIDTPTQPSAVRRWLEHWDQHGFGNCSVFEEKTGRLVGKLRCPVNGDPRRRVLNLMYRLHPSTWGRGYATEATAAL
jgi:RimJ/RimL family protein N-acetyltransferase